jgi:serine/threonine-protein kinase
VICGQFDKIRCQISKYTMIGTKLAHYEITSHIGSGGMGDVYQATDTKLGRSVAIKFLPEAFSHDTERVARFQREARVLASLNHPNIAAIHGVEEIDSRHFLVMELVPGETLAARIKRSAIPIEEALPIAKQIAEALEQAHEKGIIHRDLKPENIKITPEGKVKVLDFGLAKAYEGETSNSELSNSPTLSMAATNPGIILGTAGYMSPEQAKGRAVDKRADIWAFAAILYEMLTSKRAFPGDDVSDTLVAILRDDPDWSALPPDTPARIRQILRVCLQRDPKQRVQAIGDVRLALEGAFETATPMVGAAVVTSHSGGWRRAVIVGGLMIISAVIASSAMWTLTRPAAPRVIRMAIETSAPMALNISAFDRNLAVTPDGSRVVYRGFGQILVRSLDQLEPISIPVGGHGLFVSPDGQWIGFFDLYSALMKVAITGGPPVTLLNPRVLNGTGGATWGEDGTIIFSAIGKGLQRIPAAGGDPTAVTKLNPAGGEAQHVFPEFLPGGHGVLFTTVSGAYLNGANVQIAAIDLRTGIQKVLIRGGSDAHYVPTGHLVYAAAGTLRAVAFDLSRLEVIGTAVPVVAQVGTSIFGTANFDVAANGTLVYGTGNAAAPGRRTLVWVDRQGHEAPIKVPERTYVYPRLSPDGARVALSIRDQQEDIWVLDLARETLTRMTFDPGAEQYPTWTPDGRRLLFGSGNGVVFWQPADGTGSPEALTKNPPNPQFPYAVSPDGSRVVLREGTGSYDLVTLLLGKDSKTEPLIRTPFTELNAEISPDGRWLAYESDESGQREIYVRPFPNVSAGRWQVSGSGGTRPLWSRNGRELFYMTTAGPEATLMSAPIQPGATWSAGTPTKLFSGRFFFTETGIGEGRTYDVSPDGRRFLMIKEANGSDQPATSASLIVVLNWLEELKQRVPVR